MENKILSEKENVSNNNVLKILNEEDDVLSKEEGKEKQKEHLNLEKDDFKMDHEQGISNDESEEEFKLRRSKKKQKKKKNKKILKKRIHNTFLNFNRFKNCTSKKNLQKILFGLSAKAKSFLRFYITECFIIDIFTRKIENKKMLMSKREFFFRIVKHPELLSNDCHFDNNLLKNFCTGAGNFIEKHFFDIEYQICRKKRGISNSSGDEN